MERFDLVHDGQAIMGAICMVLLMAKLIMIIGFRKKIGTGYRKKIFGWYSNFEIYGSGNPAKVTLLSTANILTTSFWITVSIFCALAFVGKEMIN